MRGFELSECDPTGEFCKFRGLHRSSLIKALVAKLPSGSIEFSTTVNQVVSYGGESKGVIINVSRDNKQWQEECSVFVGADGARSRIAQGLGLEPPNYSGYIAYRGTATLGAGQKMPLPSNTIRQIWG